jgi:hypothetical protein
MLCEVRENLQNSALMTVKHYNFLYSIYNLCKHVWVNYLQIVHQVRFLNTTLISNESVDKELHAQY